MRQLQIQQIHKV